MEASRPQDFFSAGYEEARDRFCESAKDLGARLLRYPTSHRDDLTIDVAALSHSVADKVVVVSSGVHGVEGPFGSAVQLAWLDHAGRTGLTGDVGVVLIHAINPYGFAHHRRWNEEGIDLNRNFFENEDDAAYTGAADGYARLDPLLNPPSAPSRWEPFRCKAAWNILRHGIPALKEAIATGQYEYPRGLFFGGNGPSASTRILGEHYASWIGEATKIVHLDLHTGLGRFGDYRLLLESDVTDQEARWFADVFGSHAVEPGSSKGTAYKARGTFGGWARRQMAGRRLRFATVDFGTYGLVRILRALRAENRAHHYATDDARFEWAKEELRECFCPSSSRWRRTTVERGLGVVVKAIECSRCS